MYMTCLGPHIYQRCHLLISPRTPSAKSLLAEMPLPSLGDPLKRFRVFRQTKSASHGALQSRSIGAGILVVSKPIVAFSPVQLTSVTTSQESTATSTVYRNTSDAIQTFLPPVQAVADAIPGVGGIIKGIIGGILGTLQLVDVTPLCSDYSNAEPRHHRGTSRTWPTWKPSNNNCTDSAVI